MRASILAARDSHFTAAGAMGQLRRWLERPYGGHSDLRCASDLCDMATEGGKASASASASSSTGTGMASAFRPESKAGPKLRAERVSARKQAGSGVRGGRASRRRHDSREMSPHAQRTQSASTCFNLMNLTGTSEKENGSSINGFLVSETPESADGVAVVGTHRQCAVCWDCDNRQCLLFLVGQGIFPLGCILSPHDLTRALVAVHNR